MPGESSLITIAKRLARAVAQLTFGSPVRHVYNPLDYAWAPYCEYLDRFGPGRPQILIVGMNPSYFGMAQTGVPFGDVQMVREWLGIRTKADRPRSEHPKRPIEGDACRRREVSGQRLWGWARDRFGTPERFFAQFFVMNYCPLCFLGESGVNLPLEKLRPSECERLFAVCDRALREGAEVLGATHAIGIGRFAERRIAAVLGDRMICGGAPHPSPANPAANRGWNAEMDRALLALGVQLAADERR